MPRALPKQCMIGTLAYPAIGGSRRTYTQTEGVVSDYLYHWDTRKIPWVRASNNKVRRPSRRNRNR